MARDGGLSSPWSAQEVCVLLTLPADSCCFPAAPL